MRPLNQPSFELQTTADDGVSFAVWLLQDHGWPAGAFSDHRTTATPAPPDFARHWVNWVNAIVGFRLYQERVAEGIAHAELARSLDARNALNKVSAGLDHSVHPARLWRGPELPDDDLRHAWERYRDNRQSSGILPRESKMLYDAVKPYAGHLQALSIFAVPYPKLALQVTNPVALIAGLPNDYRNEDFTEMVVQTVEQLGMAAGSDT